MDPNSAVERIAEKVNAMIEGGGDGDEYTEACDAVGDLFLWLSQDGAKPNLRLRAEIDLPDLDLPRFADDEKRTPKGQPDVGD